MLPFITCTITYMLRVIHDKDISEYYKRKIYGSLTDLIYSISILRSLMVAFLWGLMQTNVLKLIWKPSSAEPHLSFPRNTSSEKKFEDGCILLIQIHFNRVGHSLIKTWEMIYMGWLVCCWCKISDKIILLTLL